MRLVSMAIQWAYSMPSFHKGYFLARLERLIVSSTIGGGTADHIMGYRPPLFVVGEFLGQPLGVELDLARWRL